MKHLFTLLIITFLSSINRGQCQDIKQTRNPFKEKTSNEIDSKTGDCHDDALYVIPVVFHVVHEGQPIGEGSNISDASLTSMLYKTNDYFRKHGVSNNVWPSIAADTKIEFEFAKSNESGEPNYGIVRHHYLDLGLSHSPPYDYDTEVNGVIKPQTIWNPEKYLNIWVFDFRVNGLDRVGIATFPTKTGLPGQFFINLLGLNGTDTTDGIVVDPNIFYSEPNKSWLAHEIGHYLGLLHTFRNDSPNTNPDILSCTGLNTDYCDDTPKTLGNSSVDCSLTSESCGSIDMIENFMDYSNECHQIFTHDQTDRMKTVLNRSPRRPYHISHSSSLDTYEPNDNLLEATNIFPILSDEAVDSSIQSYLIRPLQDDWFKVNITQPGILSASLLNLPDNYDFELFYQGQFFSGSFNDGTNAEQLSFNYTSNNPAEIYFYIHGASLLDYSLCEPYNLSISWSPQSSQCVPIIATLSATNETSIGSNDGTATVNINSGVAPYNIVWSNGGSGSTISGLALGTYSVSITGADGCTFDSSIYVGADGQENPYCFGQTNMTASSGSFNDGSGVNSYSNNSSCSWLISPNSNVSSINLKFISFSLDTNDTVKIYDGSNNLAPVLGRYTGTTIPPQISSTSANMYVEFITDDSLNNQGWEVNYNSNIQDNGASMRYYEYWFDNDYANKVSGIISPQSIYNFENSISTNNLLNGVHTIHFRFKDEHGLYSSVISQVFQKTPKYATNSKRLVGYEYWFDNDYSNKVYQDINLKSVETIEELINTSELFPGVHTYHLRFKDNSQLWSSVTSQLFYKVKNTVGISNLITAYRYWFDDQYENLHTINLPNPINPLNLMTDIDVSNLNQGEHTIQLQFMDTIQLWSAVVSDTFSVVPRIEAGFVVSDSTICSGQIVEFTNTSYGGIDYIWDFGDGQTSNLENPEHSYDESGIYTVILVAINQDNGLVDTLEVEQLMVVGESHLVTIQNFSCNPLDTGVVVQNLINQNNCDSIVTTFTALSNSYEITLYQSSCNQNDVGTEVESFLSTYGCDSLVTTITSISPNFNITFNYESCNPSDTGLLVSNLTTVNGCDSIVTIFTTLLESYDLMIEQTTCDPNDVGEHIETFNSSEGCDSIRTTITSLVESYNITFNNFSCIPADTGIVIENFVSVFGCDSTVTTITTFSESYDITIAETSCNPDDVGMQIQNLISTKGCDSIVTTITSLVPSYELIINDETCSPSDTGTFIENFITINGCDSIVTTKITLLTSYEVTVNEASCDSNDVGTIVQSLTSLDGCDSIVTITTILLPSFESSVEIVSCDSNDVGTIVNQYLAFNGCDSIVSITTTLAPSYVDTTNLKSCNPSNVGIIVDSFMSNNGCDSLVITNTSLLPSYEINLVETICNYEVFEIGDISFDSSGNYQVVLNSLEGCDSIINLNLTVELDTISPITFSPFEGDSICLSDSLIDLSANVSPNSGNFEGSGVSGFTFNPEIAGEGQHIIYYVVNYGDECILRDSITINVKECVTTNLLALDLVKLNIYPNPFTKNTTIDYTLLKFTDLHIELFDLSGKSHGVKLDESNHPSGRHQLIINGEALSPGIYNLQISSEGKTIYKKLVLLR